MSEALVSRDVAYPCTQFPLAGRISADGSPIHQPARGSVWFLTGFLVIGMHLPGGCSALPRRYVEQTVYNPFPELSRVAIVPFFNHSKEPTVNGIEFARAYYLELQTVPGFEVVPVDIVHQTIVQHRLTLHGPGDVRRLAQLLDVDAVVIGAVTDYRPYYPPRLGLHVEWYARNPDMQPILPGFGIPWGTRRARKLPEWIALEASLAWARAVLKHHRPIDPPAKPAVSGNPPEPEDSSSPEAKNSTAGAVSAAPSLQEAWFSGEVTDIAPPRTTNPGREAVPIPLLPPSTLAGDPQAETGPPGTTLQENGPLPNLNREVPKVSVSTTVEPVMVHTRVYSGNDPHFAQALATYYHFREESRFGGWQGYLERSEDFIRFCCRLHIHEMLMARGGAGKKRVLWDWPLFR